MIEVHEFLPTSRICLIKYKDKEKIQQVFKEVGKLNNWRGFIVYTIEILDLSLDLKN